MAPPYGFAGYVAPGPAFHAGGVPSAGDAPRPPSPIMRGVRRGGEDDSSNLDTSSDEAEDSKRGKTKTVRLAAFGFALLCYVYMLSVAINHSPLGMLSG